ncbi:hypothetical protein BST28_02550 [Mycolicibacter kumamotonensis]|uniref:Uncharacterized protein n=1 Tax=Mycolicibacter kumamotonensis TaxID=354243 RepID=A0A1X0EEA7_9MYCO|nr:hypothetical protein BST28_02550 [Mycolicibacter kumamotonensis]
MWRGPSRCSPTWSCIDGGSARLDAGEPKLGPPLEPGGSARLDAGEPKLGRPHRPPARLRATLVITA